MHKPPAHRGTHTHTEALPGQEAAPRCTPRQTHLHTHAHGCRAGRMQGNAGGCRTGFAQLSEHPRCWRRGDLPSEPWSGQARSLIVLSCLSGFILVLLVTTFLLHVGHGGLHTLLEPCEERKIIV